MDPAYSGPPFDYEKILGDLILQVLVQYLFARQLGTLSDDLGVLLLGGDRILGTSL
jgi:hypothetical protein